MNIPPISVESSISKSQHLCNNIETTVEYRVKKQQPQQVVWYLEIRKEEIFFIVMVINNPICTSIMYK